MKKRYIALIISCVLLCSCGSKPQDVVNDTSDSVLEQDTSAEETSSSVAATVNDEDPSETAIVPTTREMETTEFFSTDQIDASTEFDEDAYIEEVRAQKDADMAECVEVYKDKNAITDAPYESAITTTTSDDILDEYLFWLMQTWKSAARTINTIYDTYGIECMRTAGYTEHGNWRMYSIHKLASGAVFYLFYEDGFLRNTVLMTKSLTKEDFSGIEIGDTVEDVAEIEPAAAYWKKIDIKDRERYPDAYREIEGIDIDGFTVPLLLKDGLLMIICELRDNDYYIEDIVFHDDFKSVYPDFKYALTTEDDVYNYAILPEDYPD